MEYVLDYFRCSTTYCMVNTARPWSAHGADIDCKQYGASQHLNTPSAYDKQLFSLGTDGNATNT